MEIRTAQAPISASRSITGEVAVGCTTGPESVRPLPARAQQLKDISDKEAQELRLPMAGVRCKSGARSFLNVNWAGLTLRNLKRKDHLGTARTVFRVILPRNFEKAGSRVC